MELWVYLKLCGGGRNVDTFRSFSSLLCNGGIFDKASVSDWLADLTNFLYLGICAKADCFVVYRGLVLSYVQSDAWRHLRLTFSFRHHRGREFEMSLSDGASDDEMPSALPTEGSHGGSIRKVTHSVTRTHTHTQKVHMTNVRTDSKNGDTPLGRPVLVSCGRGLTPEYIMSG